MFFRTMYRLVAILTVTQIIVHTSASPIDRHVTHNTRILYKTLLNYTHDVTKVMFGQHGATLNGAYNGHIPYKLGVIHNGTQGWSFTNDQARNHDPDELCDMKSITGDYPAIMEFDLGTLNSLDRMAYLVQRGVDRNQVISISWHMPSPISNASFYVRLDHTGIDVRHSIRRVLPGGDKNRQFNETLDVAANWLKNLKYSNGQQAPVIFRPFHEMNGNWFWWGTNSKQQNTPQDYKHLFQYVVRYIRDVQNVHNVLYAFSPHRHGNITDYLNYYPGDDHVDILGLDFYYTQPFSPSVNTFKDKVKSLTDLAAQRRKIAALTEVGFQNEGLATHPNFWVDHVLTPLKSKQSLTRVAYMLTWDNFCTTKCEVRVPYHGHPAEASFLHFYRDPTTVFQTHHSNFVTQILG